MNAPALSVLDLVPVRSDQTTGDAFRASRSLAKVADELGYRRYWVAEHHNMPAVAATNPPVMIAMLAAATERIRVLGSGRAPGTDPLTRYVLRGGSAPAADDAVARFPEYVDDIRVLMDADGVEIALGGRRQPLRATPRATSVPTVWLLGSSDYSARLAADRGLPYVFAHHFSGQGTAEALALYRSSYQPSPEHPEPRTFLTVNAVVAETAEEARRLALPQVQAMISLRTGGPLSPQRLVEEAEQVGVDPQHQSMANAMLERWVVDAPEAARRRLVELAETFGVDEVMVHPVPGAYAGTAAEASPAREATLRLLAS